jgi:hypothetical protein
MSEYYDLSLKLLGVDWLPGAPLGIPGWNYVDNQPLPQPRQLPGGFSDATEQRIAIEVCKRVPAMDARQWAGLDEQERLPWLRSAVAAAPVAATTEIPGKWLIRKHAAKFLNVSSTTIGKWATPQDGKPAKLLSRRVPNKTGGKDRLEVFIPDSLSRKT